MVANSSPWTIHDLETLPDDGGWKRYEIIDGELFVTRAPHFNHQRVAGTLHVCLDNWSRKTRLGIAVETPGLIFTATDAVIPDLIWISRDRLVNGVNAAGHLIVAPELIVEILSPGEANERRDRENKLQLYSRQGVQEYWILSWQLQTLEIYRPQAGQLQAIAKLQNDDLLTSPLLPGFSTPVSELFPIT